MSVTAKLRYLRIAPRKVRLVADLIRGKSAEEAQTILKFTTKKAVQPILKLLKATVNSAKNNFQLEESNLYISKITVDEGPKYKRFFPRARGQAYEIQKKTSHITIVVDELRSSPPFAAARVLDEVAKKPRKRAKKGKEVKEVEVKSDEMIKKTQKMAKPPKESKLPTGQAKFKPRTEISRPTIEKGLRRIFRRKAF